MIDRDSLINAVFQRTGVKLGKDDPAFILVEINRLCLDAAVDALLAKVDVAAQQARALQAIDGLLLQARFERAGDAVSQRLQQATATAAISLVNDAVTKVRKAGPAERAQIKAAAAEPRGVPNRMMWAVAGASVVLVAMTAGFVAGYALAGDRDPQAASAPKSEATRDGRATVQPIPGRAGAKR